MEPSTNTFHAISSFLPEKVLQGLRSTPVDELALDNLVRLISGAEPSPRSTPDVRTDWAVKQTTIAATLSSLSRADNKRSRDLSESTDSATKRPRISPPSQPTKTDIEPGRPIYSLLPISTTAPVRKKVDLALRENALVLLNSTSKTTEGSPIPLSILRRAFLLPTRGKTKPHWTVVILSSDSQPITRGKQTKATPDEQQPQIIFGIDAKLSAALTTTTYDAEGTNPTSTTHAKNTETLPILREFLSHLHIPVYEPTPSIFKSAVPGLGKNINPEGVPGVEAYRAAKPGSLWFMHEGILWGESKPCEFWAVEDFLGKKEGLKVIGGIGKTCSVILTRRSRSTTPQDKGAGDKNTPQEGTTAEDEPDGEEDLGEETEFSMVDSKEKEGIENWVKQHRYMFGTAGGRTPADEPSEVEMISPVGPLTIHQMGDVTDSSDEDFTASSDDELSEDVSDSEDSGEEGEEEGEAEEGEGEGDGTGSEVSGEGEEEEEELDPKHHPLLRAGRLPKMSKAVMDMAVGMLMDDVIGGSDEEEVDELMD